MDGLIFTGNKKSFENFKNQISLDIFPMFENLRSYCLSLGENVVEDIREHRIVFGKSLSFRWFADLKPSFGEISVKIQKSRKETPLIISVKNEEKIADLKILLKEAFVTIQ